MQPMSETQQKPTMEDKVLKYIENNNLTCWSVVLAVCALGVWWRNSWV